MISKIGQVMLYVNDQDAAIKFWTEKLGFEVISEHNEHGMCWIEIAPKNAATSFVLHNKAIIEKMQPELNLGTPSLLFYAENLDALYEKFKSLAITVGQLTQMPTGKVFNFADPEGNYFAILEKQ